MSFYNANKKKIDSPFFPNIGTCNQVTRLCALLGGVRQYKYLLEKNSPYYTHVLNNQLELPVGIAVTIQSLVDCQHRHEL